MYTYQSHVHEVGDDISSGEVVGEVHIPEAAVVPPLPLRRPNPHCTVGGRAVLVTLREGERMYKMVKEGKGYQSYKGKAVGWDRVSSVRFEREGKGEEDMA